jgi:hypothetical protein
MTAEVMGFVLPDAIQVAFLKVPPTVDLDSSTRNDRHYGALPIMSSSF